MGWELLFTDRDQAKFSYLYEAYVLLVLFNIFYEGLIDFLVQKGGLIGEGALIERGGWRENLLQAANGM